MVPMLTCGLVRSNLALATAVLPGLFSAQYAGQWRTGSLWVLLAVCFGDDFLRDVAWHLCIRVELHAVTRPALGLRPKVADVAEHLRQRNSGAHDAGTAALVHRQDVTPPRV